ncbi:sigma54 specific transcriptional regulator, Fis family [Thiorhodococcus drewsii AZ1]|uniref:Sigma54 specific transcriptional regulator, Fis family n=1 Tax=Thiorhodococcus drewsii AZ1 TaxID=765913 RepID=G2E624_9GAMM|nr:sigma-54 dependent transcriptional regulator [Thiorhodococcus drewsii]EGV28509.1 sigma54 specific transcriptional regulator, Fis family [Thiorhodococcus drewsii AZ1]
MPPISHVPIPWSPPGPTTQTNSISQWLLEPHPTSLTLIVSSTLGILQASAKLNDLLRISGPELHNCPCCHLDATPAMVCRHRTLFRDLEPYSETLLMRLGDGEPQPVRVIGFPIIEPDGRILLAETIRPLGPLRQAPRLVGQSATFQRHLQELRQAAATEASVLLHGETGSGKELAAELLHQQSPRADGPFIVVDCTVLSEDLFESELFGHVKGAFTGATSHKTGLMELADKGTLFLDEIGELPLSQQPKLLRALETGTFRPVGATKTRRAKVRVISATHQDLPALIQRGAFRQDLYYRLAVLPIGIPALRERREDIPAMTEHILQQIAAERPRAYRLGKEAMRKLLGYSYPGNIRELRNLLQLATALSPEGEIPAEVIRIPTHAPAAAAPECGVKLTDSAATAGLGLSPIELAERQYILDLLREYHGSRRGLAERMGISERTLYRKLKRYALNVPNG